MNALEIKGVTKVFTNGEKALSDVSFTLKEKEFGALIGPSGSGKTTLLRCVAGLEQPDSGKISVLSTPVFDQHTSISPSKRQVGFLFQDYALFPHMNVEANVRFGISKLTKGLQNERIYKYLSLCSVDHLAHRFPHQLSGGQQQRVALARALATEPSLLLLDEPFSNVDETFKQQLRLEIAEVIQVCGISALMVVHDVKDAFAVANHIGVLVDSKVHQSESADELYRQPKTAEVARVTGEVNLITAKAADGGFQSILGHHPARHSKSPGEEATVVIRPEELHIASDGDWTVESITFNGAAYMVRCSKGMHVLDVRMQGHNTLKPGMHVEVSTSLEDIAWID